MAPEKKPPTASWLLRRQKEDLAAGVQVKTDAAYTEEWMAKTAA
jgi:hypothetical protein